jgi:hypothetical protein
MHDSVNDENVAIIADSEVMCVALCKSCDGMERHIWIVSVESTRQVQQEITTHLSQQNDRFISEIHKIRDEIKSSIAAQQSVVQ